MSTQRTRYRELRPFGYSRSVSLDGTTVHTVSGVSGRKLERFDDAKGARTTWNECSHFTAVSTEGTLPDFVETGEFPHTWHYSGNWIAMVAPDMLNGVDAVLCDPVPPPEVAGHISRKALNNVLIQLPMTVSVPNMLWELKDGLKELIPRVEKLISVKTPADLLLWWKFGMEPTIRDMKECMKLWSTAKKRLEHLRKINRRLRTLRTHDQRAWVAEPEGPPTNEVPTWNPLNPVLVSRRIKHEVDIDIAISAYYDLRELDDPLAFLNSLACAAGLGNPAAIVWEAIPFSFVVDWFHSVGDWIESHPPVQTFPGEIKILGCHTTYRSRTIIAWYAPTSYSGDWQEVGMTSVKGFCRRNSLPAGVLQTDGLTPMQQLLGTALLVSPGSTLWQRLSRRRRRFG